MPTSNWDDYIEEVESDPVEKQAIDAARDRLIQEQMEEENQLGRLHVRREMQRTVIRFPNAHLIRYVLSTPQGAVVYTLMGVPGTYWGASTDLHWRTAWRKDQEASDHKCEFLNEEVACFFDGQSSPVLTNADEVWDRLERWARAQGGDVA